MAARTGLSRLRVLTGSCHDLLQFIVVVRLDVAEEIDDGVDFLIADKCSLSPRQAAGAWSKVQHVTAAEQAFGTGLIQNDTAVHFASDLEGDTGREIGLNQSRNHIHCRLLSCQNEVDTNGTGFLSQTDNMCFHIFAARHHQIRHFVGDDHDIRHVMRNTLSFLMQFADAHPT